MTSLAKGYLLALCALFASLANVSSEPGICMDCNNLSPMPWHEPGIGSCTKYKDFNNCLLKFDPNGTEGCSFWKNGYDKFEKQCDAILNPQQPGGSQLPPGGGQLPPGGGQLPPGGGQLPPGGGQLPSGGGQQQPGGGPRNGKSNSFEAGCAIFIFVIFAIRVIV